MRIALGADHAGVTLKEAGSRLSCPVKRVLEDLNLPYRDFGTSSDESVDYPDYAARVTPRGRALEIVRTFLDTPFAGGRHQARVEKIAVLEGDLCR